MASLANPDRILVVLIFAGELRSSQWKELSGLSNSSFHSARRHLIEKKLIVESNLPARKDPIKYRPPTKQLHSIIPGLSGKIRYQMDRKQRRDNTKIRTLVGDHSK